MDIKKLSLHVLIIIIISIVCGYIYNSLSDNKIPLIYEPLNLESGSYLTIEQAYQLLTEGQTVFINARHQKDFERGHIKNAINLPRGTVREEIMKFLEPIPKDQQIVTYCDSPACDSSRRLAGLLTYLGYTKVFIYLEGLKEWEAHHYPVEK